LLHYNEPGYYSFAVAPFIHFCRTLYRLDIPSLDDVSDLQIRLRDATLNDADFFAQSYFCQTFHGILVFMRQFLLIVTERPTKMMFFCDLLEQLAVPFVRNCLNRWMQQLFTIPDFATESPHVFFILSQLLLRGIVSPSVIGHCVQGIGSDFANTASTRVLSSVYFAPEIPDHLDHLEMTRFYAHARIVLGDCKLTWVDDPHLEADGFYGWRQRRSSPDFEIPVLQYLMTDNLDKFQIHAASTMFDPNGTLPYCPFLPFPALHRRPPLISVAAFFGATRCFQLFIARTDVNLFAVDGEDRTVLHFAVAGGKLTILKAIISFTSAGANLLAGALQMAVAFGQIDAYEFLAGRDDVDMKYDDPRMGNLLGQAVERNNIAFVRKFIELNFDVNQTCPLRRAVRNQSFEAFWILLSQPRINLDVRVNHWNVWWSLPH
jgi:hypothetical protein